MISKPLFFVHIPKTAGTSFRIGAENYFRTDDIIYDYGKDSPVTSSIAQRYLYSPTSDVWAFGQACANEKAPLVCGHVGIRKFISLFGASNTFTFLRDPLERMASEYEHFVRNYDYKGSFRDFYSRPIMHNRQSKILHGVDVEAIGMLGLMECYKESLAMLNQCYEISIPVREENRGRNMMGNRYEIAPEDIIEFKRLNAADLTLYGQINALFEDRRAFFEVGVPWAHARIRELTSKRISGWAWWAGEADDPVEIEIWINNDLAGTARAVEWRPGLCHLLPARGGYVGFHFPVNLTPGDRVRCRVKNTGQWFPSGKASVFNISTTSGGGTA